MSGLKALIFFLMIVPLAAFPQAKQSALQEINQNYLIGQQEAEVRILAYLKTNPQERITFFQNGGVKMLVDVTNGIPVYVKTFNALEAITLNVPALRTGGSLGINILGTGIKIGTWDGGKVRADHVELIGRVTQVDGSSTFSDHATHTSGTMLASGVNANAKGMAPEATLLAFDFNNDLSEMTSQAKPDQTSLILSNHSYGTVCGWDTSVSPAVWRGDPAVSATEDYKFGFYTAEAGQWDALAFNAPYYTIVRAAGNDRGDSGSGPQPADGPYDCLPTVSVAKNIITVGAVQNLTSYTGPADVLQTSFSSWGPTDDGRIKPDLVAPGLNVFSCIATSTTLYETESGTSMATPATTGTLALLQQLYKSLNSGNYMRSATLKALVLHTAREAGTNPGPDYSYGWGLLDAGAAAKLIINKDNQNIFIREQVLTSGQTFEIDLGTPKPGTKITATIVWTDPAGTSPALSLDPVAKMLVNDLDLRIVDSGGAEQFPWILNPAVPTAAATKADNIRDNVEKIEFNNPDNRDYNLRVTNKGTLSGGVQAFSLILEYSSQIDPRTTYYWRPVPITIPAPFTSGGGKWSDGQHWSLTSGGPAANAIPGPNDRVVFDENSFANDTDTIVVKMPANQSCYSLRWFAKEAAQLSFNGNTLTVVEGATLLTSKITTPTAGTLNFTSTATTPNAVDLGSSILDKWTLLFNGNSSWAVTGTATLDKIVLNEGAVLFNGSALGVNELSSTGAAAKSITLTSASFKAAQSLSVNFTGITVLSDNLSSIIISPAVTNTINLSALNFPGYISMAGGEVTITGTNTLGAIQGNGIARLNGSFLVSNLNLSGGSQLILQEGTTHTFTDKIIFLTSSTQRVKILSSGAAKATVAFSDYFKICMDFVDVTNVDVTGTSIVNAGAGSTITNSSNWLKANCSGIVFPDFAVSYACVKGSTYFTDKSSGPITTRLWNFGDPASGAENTSTLASPLHYFTGTGPYSVSLTVTGASGSLSYSKNVTLLSPNDLADNTIQLNNGNFISTIIANSYQWLKDGQLINTQTGRVYAPSGGAGTYHVLIFNTTCNKRSAPYVTTAVEDENILVKGNVIKIYPNPTSDFLQIESVNRIISISILDAVGHTFPVEMEEISDERYRINVSAVPSGLYIIRTTTKEGPDLQKLIIRK